MHLKHLELQGYKSFANKTEFDFPTGITAIIGPNGTGKSNIADAIRWALGERSMSTLRAKSTVDMIFAGGDGRSRAGMAQVALTFDNEDRGLPIAYSEVTISRRAYRSGESEYYINGSQVLLRDIEELLAESSLSERTYTVIGQGVVDAALSLSSQERRALFEEAAGITLYRDRREKTVERLDETEHNLQRVQDIVSEISPRLERLERDARQVEQHRRLTAHLERLQRTWYGYQWGQRQAALERALEWAGALKERLTEQQREVSDLSRRLAEVRERQGTLRGNLRDWYRESGDLHEEVDRARQELAVSEERERLLKTRREELLEEIEPLRLQRREQAERVTELAERVEGLEEDLAERQTRLGAVEREGADRMRRARQRERERDDVESKLRSERAELERLDRSLTEAREELSRLASEQAVAEERVRQLENRREDMVARLEPLRREEEEQRQRIERGREQLTGLEQVLLNRQSALADLEEAWQASRHSPPEPNGERRELARRLRDSRAEIDRLDDAWRAAQQEEAEWAGESRALERVRSTGDAYDQGVRLVLEADLEGVVGPLAELIQVAPVWERAVETALASSLPGSGVYAIVVEQESIVDQIRGVLEEHGGKVTVLSLDGLRAAVSQNDLPSHVSSAAAVVACDAHVRPVVDVLLGPVALCETISDAKSLQPRMPGGSLCVTRAGIVLRADGVLALESGKAGSVLAEERTRRELPARLEEIRARLERLETQRRAERERAESLRVRLKEIDRQAASARETEIQRMQQEIGEARTAVAVTQQTVRSQRESLEHEVAELERLRSRQEALQVQAAGLREQHTEQVERARALRLAMDAPKLDGLGERTGHEMPPELAASLSFRGRLRRAQRCCRDLEERHRDVSEHISSLEERLSRLTTAASAARREAAGFERDTLSTVRTAVAVAEALLRGERQTLERESRLLERLRSQVDAREQRASELAAEREALLDRIVELRREDSQLEATLQTVRARIQPAEGTLERLEDRQASLEEERQRSQEQLRAAEERHGRAELDVERRRDDLQLLAQRIDEDLGLVELELGERVTAQAPLPMRPLVSQLPVVEELPEGLEDEMQFVKKRLRRLGAINPNAPAELAEVRERYEFLTEQVSDLRIATERLRRSVSELDALMEKAFKETFDAVAERFSEMFAHLFEGGEARLTLTEPAVLLRTGVDIVARPPGKRAQRLALLSGGERALTAVALLFSLLHVSPTPFCVLDEVDAMLDEANVGRFRAKLEDLSRQTQFIVVTHNRGTVESADAVYGVSMGSNAVSQVVSLKMDQIQRAG